MYFYYFDVRSDFLLLFTFTSFVSFFRRHGNEPGSTSRLISLFPRFTVRPPPLLWILRGKRALLPTGTCLFTVKNLL